MTDDLTTLLRDAGREPTIDLDVDAVHGRGRRRAVGRRVAVGAGALALLGVIGAGVATLLDGPEAPIVDQAPAEDVAPATEDPAAVLGTTPRVALAAELGRDLHLHRYDAARDIWALERTRGDGTTETGELQLPPMLGDPVVDREGRLWTSDGDGTLLLDGRLPEHDPEVARAWLPVGTTEDGIPVIVAQPGLEGGDGLGPPVLREADPSGLVLSSRLELVTAALPEGASVFRFAEGLEHAVVLGAVAPPSAGSDGQLLLLLPYGGEPRDLLAELPVADAVGGGTVVAVEVVGDEVWLAVAYDDRVSSIVRVPLDPTDEVTFLPTPDPAGVQRLEGPVTSIESGPTGEVVLLGRRDGDAWLAPLVVRRAMADDLATGAITELDARGSPTLLPPTQTAVALAACATDPDAPINEKPASPAGHAWFLCWDAMSQMEDGFAYPYVATELFSGSDRRDVDAGALLALLQAWADGPPARAAAAGLSGGLDPAVATIVDVGDIIDDEVVIDLTGGPQVGVLGTTTGRATFVQQLAGMVFQFEGPQTMLIRLDGSCEAWSVLGEADPSSCQVYDVSDAPWARGGQPTALDATDLEDGRHPVYIHAIDTASLELTVDVVQFLTGEEASAAYNGPEPDGPPNGYLIRNENPRLRTLVAAGTDISVDVVDLQGSGTADLRPIMWTQLSDYLAEGPGGGDGSLWYAPFWLTIESGLITAIEEQYIP